MLPYDSLEQAAKSVKCCVVYFRCSRLVWT